MNEFENQYLPNEEIIQIFELFTQMQFQPSQLAMNFCEECFNQIYSFDRFWKLATVKQQKFYDSCNIVEIHKTQLSDPLGEIFVKEETEEKAFVDLEILKHEIQDDLEEAQISKKTTKVNKKKTRTKKKSGTRSRKKKNIIVKIQCDWCSYSTSSKEVLDKHKIKRHQKKMLAKNADT